MSPRLHQTEQKSKLHTDITSKKFFVDKNYGVKVVKLRPPTITPWQLFHTSQAVLLSSWAVWNWLKLRHR